MPQPSQFDETDCIARAQRGEVAAFSELVTRNQDRIYRFDSPDSDPPGR